MERHEIPTHLEVADRAFLGLTMRQLLSASIGLALAFGAVNDLPLLFGARLAVAVVVLVGTAVLVLWRPAGRPIEEWAFVLLRYWSLPRVSVWRPPSDDDAGRVIREVVLPSAPAAPHGEARTQEVSHAA